MLNLSKRQEYIAVAVVLITLVSLIVGAFIFFDRRDRNKSINQNIVGVSPTPTSVSQPTKDMTVSFAEEMIKADNGIIKARIMLDAGSDTTNKVTAGVIVLKYPQDLLTVESLTTQTIQPDECNKLEISTGIVNKTDQGILIYPKFTAAIDPEQYPTSKFCYGEIIFKLKEGVQSINSSLEFVLNDSNFAVVGIDNSGNITYRPNANNGKLLITN